MFKWNQCTIVNEAFFVRWKLKMKAMRRFKIWQVNRFVDYSKFMYESKSIKFLYESKSICNKTIFWGESKIYFGSIANFNLNLVHNLMRNFFAHQFGASQIDMRTFYCWFFPYLNLQVRTNFYHNYNYLELYTIFSLWKFQPNIHCQFWLGKLSVWTLA